MADDGSNAFWTFVDEIHWENDPSLDGVEVLMRETWSKEEIKQFELEYSLLSGRICKTINERLDLSYGGGDDHTFMDLPGEIISRGKAVFLEYVEDAENLAEFGENEKIKEGFCYIFHPFDDFLEGMRGVFANMGELPAAPVSAGFGLGVVAAAGELPGNDDGSSSVV